MSIDCDMLVGITLIRPRSDSNGHLKPETTWVVVVVVVLALPVQSAVYRLATIL